MIGSLPSLRFYVTPKPSMLSAIQGRTSLLADLLRQTWECDVERHGRSAWELDDYESQAKVSVLARVYDAIPDDVELFDELFRHSPEYAEDIFDKNWTIERHIADEYVNTNLSEVGQDVVLSLPQSRRSNVAYWLDQQKLRNDFPSTNR